MVTEQRFRELVVAWLSDSFADVEAQPTLSETSHRPDYIAHTPFESYVIEVEDSWDSIYEGLGQAHLYAAESGHTPVAVFPADEVDAEELAILDADGEAPRIVTL